MKAKLAPSVTGGVGSTTTKMQLCQEEEFVRHGAIRMGDGNCLGAPVYRHAACFKDMPASTIVTGSLQIVVWHECEIAVGIGIAISELDCVPVGFETLDITAACSVCWNNTKKDVLFHEGVLRSGVTMETVD